jgi:hypothetical protein
MRCRDIRPVVDVSRYIDLQVDSLVCTGPIEKNISCKCCSNCFVAKEMPSTP